MENNIREKLVEELNLYRKKSKAIHQQIKVIDYENRLSDALQYKGKCYQEKNESHKESIRCVFVYGTDKESCELMALSISYWIDNLSSYFTIEYHSCFHPKQWEDDANDWLEITKADYMAHYEEVQKRILLAIS